MLVVVGEEEEEEEDGLVLMVLEEGLGATPATLTRHGCCE